MCSDFSNVFFHVFVFEVVFVIDEKYLIANYNKNIKFIPYNVELIWVIFWNDKVNSKPDIWLFKKDRCLQKAKIHSFKNRVFG